MQTVDDTKFKTQIYSSQKLNCKSELPLLCNNEIDVECLCVDASSDFRFQSMMTHFHNDKVSSDSRMC